MNQLYTLRLMPCIALCLCVAFVQQLTAQCTLGSINLTVVAAPEPSLNAPTQLCPNTGGTITVTQTFSTYNWSTSATTQSISVAGPGTYTVTVSNSAGCTGTASTNIAAAPAPDPNITQNTYTCNGQITLNAGSGFNTYAWSNSGGSSQTATYSSSGTYTVTVTNAQGCTGTDDFTVTIPTPPQVNITGNLSFCAGQSTTLTATPGFTTYAWSNSGNQSSTTVNQPGTYTVTVTDAFGCTDTESANVTTNPAPTPTVANAEICPGGTTTLSVNNGPFQSYDWSNSGTQQSITVNGPGTYTVTVTATNGCTGTTTANVALLPAPTPTISQTPYTCNGQVTLNAGAGFVTYNWSNSGNQQTTTVNQNGTYTVTVTGANGCTGTDDFTVTIPTAPQVDITGDNQICQGDNSVLTASTGFSYQWSNSSNQQSITVTQSGTYTVTATDVFGCTDTDSFTLTVNPNPVPTVSGPTQFCEGNSITLTVNPTFTSYQWSNGGGNQQTTTVTQGGTYVVTVTDANGCTGTDSQTVTELPSPNPVINQLPYACNGTVTLDAGAGFTTYNWSNSGNQQQITTNQSGTFTVTVTTANGCTGTDDFQVNIPTPPQVDIIGDNQICQGNNSILTASTGFTYQWSNSSNQPSITVTQSGTYTVTATDAFGCTDTDSFTLTVFANPVPNINGPTQFCDGNSITLTVNPTFPTYQWNNGGGNQQTTTVTQGGTYIVTVTDANGCTGTDSQAVTELAAPNPNITEGAYACDGQLTLNAGAGFANYAWSNSGNTQQITVNQSGTYTVTVTSANGCTGTDVYSANIPPSPQVSISGPTAICPGSSNTLSATPGFVSYIWNTNSTNPAITITAGGNYEVTATDAFGCTTTDNVGVSLLAAPTPNISGPSQICAGGSATFSVPGAFSAYFWSNASNQPSITVNQAGTYTVTVTAANGCTGTDTQTLAVSTSLQPNITEAPYTCNGSITLDAGTGFTTYAWSNAGNQQSISVTQSGNYTVTVSDATGCTGTAVSGVNIPVAPMVDITGNNNICAGSSTVLNATTGLNAYVWSTSQVGPSITVSTAGTYTITATDGFGCTATDEFLLVTVAAPQPDISGPTIICINSSGSLNAGSGFATYAWSNSGNTQQITVNQAGTYTVTVSNAQGCTGTDSQTVSVATGLAPEISALPYACNGQFVLNAGAGFQTYNWSQSGNQQQISVNQNGTYTVTVTDATGCTGTDEFLVNIPPAPQVSITGQLGFCANANTTLNATAGFVQYAWSNTNNTAQITVNQGGTYTVTVTDANGCTDTESVAVTANPLPQPQVNGPAAVCDGISATLGTTQNFVTYAWSNSGNTPQITVNQAGTYTVTVTDANGCSGSDVAALAVNPNPNSTITALPYACNGQIALSAGAGFSIYNWSNTGNQQQISVSQSGTYSVTVTDANGCTATATQSTTVPALAQVNITGKTEFCAAASTTLEATAGFLTYAWSNSGNTAQITVNQPGNYTVTATDALGCTATAVVSASNFPQQTPAIAGPQSVCPGNTATLSVNGNFTQFNWSNTSTTASITVQPPLAVSVTVTDANGCTGTAATTVIVSNQLSPVVTQLPYACDGKITLDAGAGFQTYAWSGAISSGQTATINQSGTYTVTVSDGGGCSGTASAQVTIPANPQVAITGDTRICIGENTALTATAGFAKYDWSGAISNNVSATTNQAGTYTVTVTDAIGCTATNTIVVQNAPTPTVQISGASVLCNNIAATLDAGSGFQTYAWNGGNGNQQTATINQAGTYTVTVSNADGCTATDEQLVTPGGNVQAAIIVLPYQCDQKVTLQANAGFQKYAWSGGISNNQSVTVNQSGIYTVTITNAAGCTGTATAQAVIPTPPTASISGNTSFCSGTSTTLSGLVGFVKYDWSGGAGNLQSATITQAGTYTLTVTDLQGCTATASAQITESNLNPTLQQNEVLCEGTTITISVTGAYEQYRWSDNSVQSSIIISQPGTYTVTVTDAQGCTGSTTSVILAVPPAKVSISGPTALCKGNTITLTSTGSVGTFTWTGNVTGSTFTVTQPGTYSVTIRDVNGCTAVTSTVVNEADPKLTNRSDITCIPSKAGIQTFRFTAANGCDSIVTITTVLTTKLGLELDLESPINAKIGSEITLDIAGNFAIDSVRFVSPFQLSCSDCLDPKIKPAQSGVIQVTAFDEDGCSASGEIRIVLNKKFDIYVPNIFKPGSAQNGFFSVFSDIDIPNVRNFNVYDRWGNAIFSRDNMPTNDPTAGWDGSYRGQKMQPGVYVYYFVVDLPDGTEEVYSGDVTIVE